MNSRFSTYYCKHLLSFLLALLAGCLSVQAQTFTIEAESAYPDNISILHPGAAEAAYGTTSYQCGAVTLATVTDIDGKKEDNNALCINGFANGMYSAKYTLEVPSGQGGTYNVLAYISCTITTRYFTFQANEDAPRAVKIDVGSNSWTANGKAYFQVNLKAGTNTLYLGGMLDYDNATGSTSLADYSYGNNSMTIDKFVFTKAGNDVTMPSANEYKEIPMNTCTLSGGKTVTDTDAYTFKYKTPNIFSLENNGTCTFTYTAPAAGYYLLNLVYASDRQWSINVAVNGGDPQTILFLSSGNNTEAKFCRQVLVKLNEGDNTITLDANGSYSPWFDYMYFTRVVPDNFTYEAPEATYSTTTTTQVRIKLKAADGTDLGYFDNSFNPGKDRDNAAILELSKNSDGTYYIKVPGTSYCLVYNLYGVIYQDADGNYYRAGDWTTKYTTPQFQYYDAYPVSGTAEAKNKTYPRLISYSGETDFSTSKYNLGTEVVAQNADGKDITAYKGAYAHRYCKFRIMADGRLSFVLKDNTFQNNSQSMSKSNELACGASPYVDYGYTFARPLYFKVISDLNDNLKTADILYPITDESQAASLVIEEINIIGFEHSVGAVYDGTVGSTIPKDLTYSTVYKTSADDPRIGTGVTLQRTHEYTHEIYVMPGQTYNLEPFSDFHTVTNYKEVYTRWFDYRTDTKSTRLSFNTTTVSPNSVFTIDKGYIGGSLFTGNHTNGSIATYTADASPTADANGVIDIIAIEAANKCTYTDNTTSDGTGNYKIKEPTLQFRHLFFIKDAKTRADEMTATETSNTDYIAAHKVKLMCPGGVPFQYRLDCYEPTQSNTYTDYWYKTGDDANPYARVPRYRIETWEDGVKVGSTTYTSASNTKSFNTNLFYTYKTLNSQARFLYIRQPEAGHNYTIKIFAYDGSNDICIAGTSTPIELMEYDVEVLTAENGNMITEEELNSSANDAIYAHQRPANMPTLYGSPTTVVNFDNISTSDCTASSGNYYYKWPWKWENSSYAFGYASRYDYNMYMVANNTSVTPYHAAATNVYDRLYQDTGGKQKGFFYYANAASDPSRMAVLNIGKDFCSGTRVYVSAWVMECSAVTETANVVFSFRGVDDDGNETLINSFATGYVTGGGNTTTGDGDGGNEPK